MKGTEYSISDKFYSNCFFEAIKAKLNNWKYIRIYRVPSKYNSNNGVHYYWSNIKEPDIYYEFHMCDNPKNHILFKGTICKFDKDMMEVWRNLGIMSNIKKFGKKLNFNTWQGNYFNLINSLNFIPIKFFNKDLVSENNMFIGAIKVNNEIFHKLYKIDATGNIINTNNDNIVAYRPFNEIIDSAFLLDTYNSEFFSNSF